MIFRGDETDCIPDGLGAPSAPDAMDVVLGMHWKIVIHDMRNSIDVDSAGCDISRHQHAHSSGFEVLQSTESLILRAVRMDRSRFDSTAFEAACNAVGAVLGAGENKNGVELRIGQEMKQERGL